MNNTVFHKADTRGHANHGWLNSHHSFSFANYHNPERMNFGALRVLNDDVVDGGMGFGLHPHQNMEIISIPLQGDLEHQDSMGNSTVIKQGDVQVMSAGTGIYHSEYNKNKDQKVKFLQIWVIPNQQNVTPRYDQITLNPEDYKNKLLQIITPNPNNHGVWIHQNAWFNLGKFDQNNTIDYSLNQSNNGVYTFIINGKAKIGDQEVSTRDGFGIWNTNSFKIEVLENDTEILLMEVPMKI